MAVTTDFDILVNHKNQDQGRKEKRPLFFTRIHGVPKQISDSSQSIGINEKTRKDGLMSGVILPSQISHDRWLSVYDAILDSFIIFSAFLFFSYFNISLIIIFSLTVMMTYMYFHILWYENSMQWYFIETIKDYVNQTRRYYYATFVISYFLFITVGYFFSYKYNVKEIVFTPIRYYERVESFLKNNEIISTKIFKMNEKKDNGKSEFSNEKTFSKKDNVQVSKKEDIIETKTDELTNSDVLNFAIYNLISIIYLYFVYKYASSHYTKKRKKNISDADTELKSNLEIKMEQLKKIF